MKTLEYMARYNYEQLVLCHDGGTGLQALIAIHDTTLGPALGGVRMHPYASEDEAILDALRLARAMTYKAAVAGLNLGGGKAVIMADPARDKSEALFRSLGRFVESLGGRYIATEDVGVAVRDMEWLSTETDYVTGLPLSQGGSDDPSPFTALGVIEAMRACAAEKLATDSLKGLTVALQGLGKVGRHLAHLLRAEGAILLVADINPQATRWAQKELGATVVPPEDIHEVICDIFAPCALGGILNRKTIPRLKSPIVCGSANNQLLEEADGARLERRGILYAPDFVANAGGLINLSLELTGYDEEEATEKVRGIRKTLERVFERARAEKSTTAQAADRTAEERIEAVRRVRGIYLER